jgi:hypothetical protein
VSVLLRAVLCAAGVLSYQHYGGNRIIKGVAWTAAAVLALLIISARKHYTVDVVIAWYTAPLVYCCLNMYWSHRQQQQQSPQANSAAAAAPGIYYHPCCVSDNCTHGLCGSCERCCCSCSCCNPKKKLQHVLTPRSSISSPSGFNQREDELLGSLEVDGNAVITFGGSALKLPSSTVSARTPTAHERKGSWSSGLAAVWAYGHRRLGSDSSSSSSGSSSSSSRRSSSWGLQSVGSSDRLQGLDSAGFGAV